MRKLFVFAVTVALLFGFVTPAEAAAPYAKIRVSRSQVTVGQSVTIKGRVTPSLVGHKVKLQKWNGRRWRTVAVELLNAHHRYWFHLTPAHAGTKTYRVAASRWATGTQRVRSASVTVVVTRPATASCTPGYSPCIPPGADVDCAGGSGNGPRYVEGPVTVTGADPYDLDRDGNGVGCQ